jgi:hypothetical protein
MTLLFIGMVRLQNIDNPQQRRVFGRTAFPCVGFPAFLATNAV